MIYAVARYFGWTRKKWRRVPWHDQRLYIEQLALKGLFRPEEEDDGPVDLDKLSSMGFTVERS